MSHVLRKFLPLTTALSLTTVLLAGCTLPDANTTTPGENASPPTLYQALGGETGVAAVVDGLLARIARDPRIVQHFEETDIAIFRERLIEHLCAVTDGGCVYQGESMADSHKGLNITQADFDALVGHLIESLKAQQIPTSTRNALLKRLAPMYSDVTYQ
ncbi:group 1 truncated hemoglobin [Shewanella amazonensis]|uniref:Globin n=1 Tax=Shewanella amazonensis (strain ATCC BAA-1098 / SB2B) TaxID=326297 RepID=A1SAB3_SHEAM|nr:group 1 truncated hemoglobin [Shewanella amazonensis]ABM01320.1 globin [Shewanella amazonensis SB2B]